jgi:hypothetical protein
MAAQERISIEQLKRGDIITFYYMSGTDVRPVILYLNTFESHIHGINLNYLSSSQLEYLKTILSNNIHTDIESPKLFYENQIKNTPIKSAYRHYIPQKMIQLFKLGYKTETLENDLGLKPKDTKEVTSKQSDIITPVTKDGGITKTDIKTSLPDNIFGTDYTINTK